MRVSVPFDLVRVGAVIDVDGKGRFVVATHTGEDKDGNAVIVYVDADGQRDLWSCPIGTTSGRYARVGKGCTPTPEGLRDFIAHHLKSPPTL